MRPGTSFHGSDVRPAGHVFVIPAQERPGDDPKNRPHFLLNRCDPAVDPHVLGTLAHMSTKATEISEYGCAGHEIVDTADARGAPVSRASSLRLGFFLGLPHVSTAPVIRRLTKSGRYDGAFCRRFPLGAAYGLRAVVACAGESFVCSTLARVSTLVSCLPSMRTVRSAGTRSSSRSSTGWLQRTTESKRSTSRGGTLFPSSNGGLTTFRLRNQ